MELDPTRLGPKPSDPTLASLDLTRLDSTIPMSLQIQTRSDPTLPMLGDVRSNMAESDVADVGSRLVGSDIADVRSVNHPQDP